MKLTKNASIIAGVASAVVGTACLVALVQSVSASSKSASKKAKKSKKKAKKEKKGASKSKSAGSKTTRELVFKIEKECIAEFKAYLPQLGEAEAKLFQQAQAGGRAMTQEMSDAIQATLIKQLEGHLEAFKKKLCEKYECSERKHDRLVSKLLDEKDPEIMKLMEESEKLWGIFKPSNGAMDVPDHIDEDAAIAYITRSFKLVMDAMAAAQAEFVTAGSAESLAEFRTKLRSDEAMAAKFNDRFRSLLDESKKKLMAEFKLESEAVAAAIVAKFQGSPKFNAEVGKAKQEMDAFFQQGSP